MRGQCCKNVGWTERSEAHAVFRSQVQRGHGASRLCPPYTRYLGAEKHFQAHKTVTHSDDEYVKIEYPITGDPEEVIHTNSAEGYFSIFKRGMRGVYQHCKEKHLHRYLAEFDHRYNHRVALGYSDIDRTLAAIRGVAGKRLASG
jgi:ISXO2-like transposase domain